MPISAAPDPVRLAYAYARRLGLSREDAQDCASDFRLHLMRVTNSYPQGASPSGSAAWLHRCAHNYAANYLRSLLRRQQRERAYCEQSGTCVPRSGEPISRNAGPAP